MRREAFSVKLERTGGLATISIAGDLDLRTLDQLAALVDEALDRKGTTRLVLDLREVMFLDSSGLRLLVELHDRAGRESWDLRLLAPDAEEALLVLRVTGAVRSLPFEPLAPTGDEQKALRSAMPGQGIEMQLDRDHGAPGAARAATASYCDDGEVGQETKATVLLLASEVVTNAVIHPDADPGAKIGLKTHKTGRRLRIEVTDQGSGFKPTPRDPSQLEGGYGLYLLDQAATSWGVQHRNGNTVWFEVAVIDD